MKRYIGAWFQVAKDIDSPFENGNCAQSRYSLNANGSVAVLNSQFINETATVFTVSATAECEGAQCKVWFPNLGPAADYRVLSTDYDRYVVVYSCRPINDQ